MTWMYRVEIVRNMDKPNKGAGSGGEHLDWIEAMGNAMSLANNGYGVQVTDRRGSVLWSD